MRIILYFPLDVQKAKQSHYRVHKHFTDRTSTKIDTRTGKRYGVKKNSPGREEENNLRIKQVSLVKLLSIML